MTGKKDAVDEKIDAQLDVFIEHTNDQFDRVIEAIQGQTETLQADVKKIPVMSERLEKLENTMASVRLDTMTTSSTVSLLKARSNRSIEEYESLKHDVISVNERITKLEAA